VEIDNGSFRLKPGMYAKVSFVIEHKEKVLVVPANSVVDSQGKKGVYVPGEGDVAKFQPVTIGMMDPSQIEITNGVTEGMRVISTGAAALRDGDKIVLLGQGGGRGNGNGSGGGRGGRGGRQGGGGGGEGGGRRGSAPSAQ
jgi:multidrug efflux pump subunit AcrA (membrane-fusion protein)